MKAPMGEFDEVEHDGLSRGPDSANWEDFGNEIQPASTASLASVLDAFFEEIEKGTPPVRWPVGEGWGTFALRPHEVTVIGGAPESGKTALFLNLIWQAMQLTPTLRVIIANNESEWPTLMERMTAMIAGVNLRHVQDRDRKQFGSEKRARAKAALQAVADRIDFVEMTSTLEQVIESAMKFRADIVVLDTLQKTRLAGFDGEVGDRIGRIMPMLRDLAHEGPCVLAAAQLSREGTKHMKFRAGSSTRDELDLAAFYGNSEIESSADNAFLLVYEKNARVYQQGGEAEYVPIPMELRDVKSRNRQPCNIPLLFDGRYQKFTVRQIQKAEKAAVGRPQPAAPASTRAKPATNSGSGKRTRSEVNAMPASADFTNEEEAHEGHEWLD